MVKNIPPQMLAKIKEISKKTMDISDFLINEINIPINPLKPSDQTEMITYHDPCHLKKSLSIFAKVDFPEPSIPQNTINFEDFACIVSIYPLLNTLLPVSFSMPAFQALPLLT